MAVATGSRMRRASCNVSSSKQLSPRARELVERAVVESHQEFGDRGVELGQGEERAVAKRGRNPALDHLQLVHTPYWTRGSRPITEPRSRRKCRISVSPADGPQFNGLTIRFLERAQDAASDAR